MSPAFRRAPSLGRVAVRRVLAAVRYRQASNSHRVRRPISRNVPVCCFENLVRLERGSADISNSTATLTGAPADDATAEAVRVAMTPVGVAVDLDPPQSRRLRVHRDHRKWRDRPRWFRARSTERGEHLDSIVDVSASGLQDLARGAPERFDSAIDFGLDLLEHLSEGRFALRRTRPCRSKGAPPRLPISVPSKPRWHWARHRGCCCRPPIFARRLPRPSLVSRKNPPTGGVSGL